MLEILMIIALVLLLVGAIANLVGLTRPGWTQPGWIAIVVGMVLVVVVHLAGPGGALNDDDNNPPPDALGVHQVL
jgi:hypothetical protein